MRPIAFFRCKSLKTLFPHRCCRKTERGCVKWFVFIPETPKNCCVKFLKFKLQIYQSLELLHCIDVNLLFLYACWIPLIWKLKQRARKCFVQNQESGYPKRHMKKASSSGLFSSRLCSVTTPPSPLSVFHSVSQNLHGAQKSQKWKGHSVCVEGTFTRSQSLPSGSRMYRRFVHREGGALSFWDIFWQFTLQMHVHSWSTTATALPKVKLAFNSTPGMLEETKECLGKNSLAHNSFEVFILSFDVLDLKTWRNERKEMMHPQASTLSDFLAVAIRPYWPTSNQSQIVLKATETILKASKNQKGKRNFSPTKWNCLRKHWLCVVINLNSRHSPLFRHEEKERF